MKTKYIEYKHKNTATNYKSIRISRLQCLFHPRNVANNICNKNVENSI